MTHSINIDLFWLLNKSLGAVADSIAIAFTFTGYAHVAIPIALLAFWFYKGWNKRSIKFLIVAVIVGGIGITSVKAGYPTSRPLGYFAKISKEEGAKVHAPYRKLYHGTFPSGHSQTGFTIAMVIVLLFGRDKWLWFSWAALVAISRVRLGLHFPLDIVAGSAWGAISAYLSFKLMGYVTPKKIPEKSSESG